MEFEITKDHLEWSDVIGVLILILMEFEITLSLLSTLRTPSVLILILMEFEITCRKSAEHSVWDRRLNPYSNGI